VLSALVFILFVVFIFLKIPVAMAIGIAVAICFIVGDFQLISIPQQMAASTKSIPLMAIPFFIFAGNLMNEMGVTKKIFDFSNAVVGSIRGGLAHVNILASMIFAGISGAALADAAGLGTIEIKAMKESGYDESFSAAITAASATIGPIIPPSIMMVIYAIMANVSIAKMFLAGIVPGILIGVCLMLFIYYRVVSGKQECPSPTPWSFKTLVRTTKDGILAVLSPVIIIWGMVGGVVTPTEAGVLAIGYSILLGAIFKSISLQGLIKVTVESVMSTSLIMYIIAVSSAMSWMITMEGTPIMVAEWLGGLTSSKFIMLILVNVFLLILGCILETLPAMLISVPILLPVTQEFGIDPIHFGIILIFNLLVGIITPPMGIGLYVMTAVSDVKFENLVKSCRPFLVALVISLLAITFIPSLCLYLPNLLMR
jgi:tripartite ATP-independent transporter DctM subunit